MFIDYLKKGKTITGEYYTSLLKAEIVKKRPHLKKKKTLFYQDNAPSHTSAVAMAKIYALRFALSDHLPYSPDLALSNFFLFPALKVWLGGQRFSSNKEIIASVEAYFAEQNANYYLNGLKKWEHCWKKCIDLKETMLKNKTEFDRKNTCFYVRLKTFQTIYVYHLIKCNIIRKNHVKSHKILVHLAAELEYRVYSCDRHVLLDVQRRHCYLVC